MSVSAWVVALPRTEVSSLGANSAGGRTGRTGGLELLGLVDHAGVPAQQAGGDGLEGEVDRREGLREGSKGGPVSRRNLGGDR